MTALAQHFEEGGWGMYWVLACSIVAVSVALGKGLELYRPRPSRDEILAVLERSLAHGDLAGAISRMLQTRGEVARLALAGLTQALETEGRVEASLAAQLSLERPPLLRGLPMLLRAGQIATLCGLLGAIRGLSGGFHHYGDASSRACALAAQISESMNCTAFGLLVSAVALLLWWMLDTRAQTLDGELEHAARAIQNLIVHYQSRLRWLGARAPIERGLYRTTD